MCSMEQEARAIKMRITIVVATIASMAVSTTAQHFTKAYTKAAMRYYSMNVGQASKITVSHDLALPFGIEASIAKDSLSY